MSKIKNIPDFELCQQLKAAGYPQPTSEFGQFWYADPSGRLCVGVNNGNKVEQPTAYVKAEDADILADIVRQTTGFAYAPTVPEMMEYIGAMGKTGYILQKTMEIYAKATPISMPNDLANHILWRIEWEKESAATIEGGIKLSDEEKAEQDAHFQMFGAPSNCDRMKANPAPVKEYHEFVKTVYIPGVGDAYQEGPHTHIKSDNGGFILPNTKVEDAVKLFESVKKFDEANPVPFYKTPEYKAKQEAEEKEKAQFGHILHHWFDPGNVLLVCFGRDGDNVQDVLVLGHDFGIEHVKLQNKEGVSFWKKRKHVFVKSILANINRPIDPSVSHIIRAFLPVETFFRAEKTSSTENERLAPTGTLTTVRSFIAGEKLNPGEAVFVASDGKIMKSDRSANPE